MGNQMKVIIAPPRQGGKLKTLLQMIRDCEPGTLINVACASGNVAEIRAKKLRRKLPGIEVKVVQRVHLDFGRSESCKDMFHVEVRR